MYINALKDRIPLTLIKFYNNFRFCRRVPRIFQFLAFLVVIMAINVLVFSYLYHYPGLDVNQEQKKFINSKLLIASPVLLFSNYPRVKGLQGISLDQCQKKVVWPPWERHSITRTLPTVPASCSLLWKGDAEESKRVMEKLSKWKNVISDSYFLRHYLTNCSAIQSEFNNFYVSQEEIDFPIAYQMVIHASVQQVVRFLKVIYRSHNAYCVHIDKKSSSLLKQSFETLAKCLPNFHIARKSYDVRYQTIDQVDAMRSCYTELLDQSSVQWKYTINLCGKELPLKTNREIVRELKSLKGANLVNPGISLMDYRTPLVMRKRIHNRIIRNPIVKFSSEPLDPVPHNIQVYKNQTFFALMPDFVRFLFENEKANDFYLFLRETRYPDEQYITTLNRLPEAPGGFNNLVTYKLLDNLPQVSMTYWVEPFHYLSRVLPDALTKLYSPNGLRCQHLNSVHRVCIASVSDLPDLLADSRTHNVFFFNKYLQEDDHVVMNCAEQELLRRNQLEFQFDCKNQQQKP